MIVCKYKFDKSIYSNLIPVFNDGYNGYTVTDEIDSTNSNHIIRTIECDVLPTMMRFGRAWASGESITNSRTDSLLEILDMNTSGLTNCHSMFRYNTNLTSLDVSNFDTKNVTNMYAMFYNCNNLTSLDVSNFNTINVTDMGYMFTNCQSLISLDVSNFDTSNVTSMNRMFCACQSLTSLDLSNFDTSKVTDMSYMFDNCNKLTSLDVSNFNTSKLTSTERLSNRWWYPNHSIGMLYCDKDTINKLIPLLKGNGTPTIYVKDVKPNELTPVEGIEFKEYKENSYIINLSSPLLNGDRIEVVDGKLCHYHKMGKVVLGYHDSWTYGRPNSGWNQNGDAKAYYLMDEHNIVPNKKPNGYCYTEKIKTFKGSRIVTNTFNENCMSMGHINYIIIRTTDKSVGENNNSGFKQWLSENPITVIYELAQPYYEDITPLQSDIALETYLESNLDIYTKLPIKTNVSYITNVPSLSTLSMRATEMKESDNIIANLTNMLDNEINE